MTALLLSPAMLELLVQLVVLPLVGAGAAWLVTKLPGPMRDFLASSTHQRDMALLTGALARRAQAAVSGAEGAKATSSVGIGAAADLVEYAKAALPETLGKLAPSNAALLTMAQAALAGALSEAARTTAALGAVAPRADAGPLAAPPAVPAAAAAPLE